MQPSNHEHRQGRLNWLTEIYRAYAADLQRSIYSKVGDLALAEDLTSTVFLKALRWLRDDQSLESARGWLYATARTTIVDYWQTQSPYEMRSLSDLEAQFLSSESAEFAGHQAEMRVEHLLSLLPERDRNILTLRYLQGYSAAEIAEALGTSASHIRVLQLRALRRAAQVETMERNRYSMQEQESPFDSFAKFMAPESRRVLDLAREEMLALSHWWIGTEHLLWGLASEESLASFLRPLGITPERIHAGIVFIFDRQAQQNPSVLGEPQAGDVSADVLKLLTGDVSADALKLLTPRAKKVIVLAAEETKNRGEKNIRPTHLLLGLMNEGEGIGAGLLRSLGISLLQARTALTPPEASQNCSFCGRSGSQVARLFPAEVGVAESGSISPSIFICNQCVQRFHAMLGTASM
jgi:RNA polymerase sigma factor (sigma-70 family)